MVVVEMREERVCDIDRPMTALQQPVMRAGSVVPDDEIAADFDEIAGALTLQRRRWRAGAEQRDAERLRRRRCRLIIRGARDRGRGRRRQHRDELASFHGEPSYILGGRYGSGALGGTCG